MDQGISGTGIKHRDGFQKMVEDALAGKITLIVTKSVSRFARNTVDSLTTIRKLKEVGCEVFFEEQNIWTFDARGELLISIMSSIAQEESRSISQNVTWGWRKRCADGKVAVPYGRFMGYDRGEDGNLVINEEQAKIIRRIYALFLEGMTPYGIAKLLTREGVKTPGGKDKWGPSVIKSILKNEKFKGDALLQKTFTTDYLTKKKKVNEGEVPQYYIEENHPAIIEPVVFDQVQREMARRSGGHSGVSIFSGKIMCAECGNFYGSKVWHSTDKYRRVIWQCNHKFDGDRKCSTPHLTEEQIQNAFLTAVNKALHGREKAIAAFEKAKETVFNTAALEVDAAAAEAEMLAVSEKIEALIRENATVALNQDEYQQHFQAMSTRFDEAKNRREGLMAVISDKKNRKAEIEDYLEVLKKQEGCVTEFSPELWCGMVDHVTVGENMALVFRDGTEVAV